MRSAVWFVALSTLVIVGAVSHSDAKGQGTPPAAPQTQGQPQAGAPPAAGGQRAAPPPPQNLKVLPKDWTRQQVQAVMSTFMESLGLDNSTPEKTCAHCHAPNPNAPPPAAGRGPALDYALDANPKKDVARKMIQMVMAANEALKTVADPKVDEPISCFTCHRGDSANKPLAAPAAGWARGSFTLLPPGPVIAQRGRGGL